MVKQRCAVLRIKMRQLGGTTMNCGMIFRRRLALLCTAVGAALVASLVTGATPAMAALPNCTATAFTKFHVPYVTVTSVIDVAARAPNPEYCQVVGAVLTDGEGAGKGSAEFLLRLPQTWNNRFVFMGCGGTCGSIGTTSATTGIVTPSLSVNAVDSGEALSLGYAVVNTDTGHENIAGEPDPTWSILAPGVPNQPGIADFYYRSVHQVTEAAKQLVEKYNSGRIKFAYFDGCSTGGRQAVVSADRFPDDFDGVISGDPIIDLVNIKAANIKEVKSFLPTNAFISNATIAALDAQVLANCDALDGTSDGLIQNPQACTINPNSLVGSVLTQPQADGVTLFLKQLFDTRGEFIYPGMAIGHWATAGFSAIQEFRNAPAPDPTSAQPWGARGVGPVIWTLGDPGIRYFTERDPNFDTINAWPQGPPFTKAANIVDAEAAKLLQQTSGEGAGADPKKLRDFIRRGHKMILYHGFSDPLASPYRTIWYYRELAEQEHGDGENSGRRQGNRDWTDQERDYRVLQENVRLFMVPGMGHCSGGTSPNNFDTLQTLANWVENGVAPEAIPASAGNGRTMPLCKFPEEASYVGGPVNSASSWTCNQDDHRLLQIGLDGLLAGLDHNSAKSDD
jgi:feruloyl esterase